MRLLPYGEHAVLIETAEPLGLAAALRSGPGVIEVVPAARTVLVRLDDSAGAPRAAVAAALRRRPEQSAPATPTAAEAAVQVTVRYDGVDLDTVAGAIGISNEALVARHCSPVYTVAFCGFAPGFAYLTGLDPALAVPRLDEPRTSVPAGSVGIAGEFTGVYPRASPGGWRLLGHTAAVLWGHRSHAPGPAHPGHDGPIPADMIEVLNSGPLACVQDLGRPGYAELGVARSGAFDRGALALANRLVGNAPVAAAVEITLGGLTILVHDAVTLCLTGAACPGLAWGTPVTVPSGSTVSLGVPPTGLRSYFAFRGGVDVATELGSRSTDTLGGLGPTALQRGDQLPIGRVTLAPVSGSAAVPLARRHVLRVVPGPREDWFVDAIGALTSSSWTVRADSDRIGVRLDGPALHRVHAGELPSEPTLPGALQVPPDGRPILFGPDAPVTGGYPVIAVVREADLDVAAQLRPGDTIGFRP